MVGTQDERVVALHEAALDLDAAPRLEQALEEACAEGVKRVVLDLSAVQFMDSSGLRAVLMGERFCDERDTEYVIADDLAPRVEAFFRRTRTMSLLRFVPVAGR